MHTCRKHDEIKAIRNIGDIGTLRHSQPVEVGRRTNNHGIGKLTLPHENLTVTMPGETVVVAFCPLFCQAKQLSIVFGHVFSDRNS